MQEMIEEAKQAIINSSKETAIYIGADSIRYKKNSKFFARYCIVIILHIDQNHGGKIYHHIDIQPDYGSIKQRLLTEVHLAVTTAYEILDIIGNRKLEIHLDLNPNPSYKSSVAVKEALGYVKGCLGLDAEVKPSAWAASSAADHAVKHGVKKFRTKTRKTKNSLL
jgi:uncharacterized protein